MGAAVTWKAKCDSLQAELEETQFESRRMRQRVALSSQPAALVPQPKQLAAGQPFLVPPAPAQAQRPVHVAASPQKVQAQVAASPQKVQESPARASGIESLTAPLVQKRQALAAATLATAKARESSAKDGRSTRSRFPRHTASSLFFCTWLHLGSWKGIAPCDRRAVAPCPRAHSWDERRMHACIALPAAVPLLSSFLGVRAEMPAGAGWRRAAGLAMRRLKIQPAGSNTFAT